MGNSWVVDNEQEEELTHLILIQVIWKKNTGLNSPLA